jgi:hypothetical protein
MNVRRALFIAVVLASSTAMPAAAQFQAATPAQEPPPCIKQFITLRNAAAKKAQAIKLASERHATPKEACRLFDIFSAAEAKMVKFASANGVWCGIPNQAMKEIKKAHARTLQIRAKVCSMAAAPPRPQGPSLSDALTPTVPDAANIRSGSGAFDTLTGSPLGSK